MKKLSKRFFGTLLAIIILISMAPNGVLKASATNADAKSTITTGSIISFGSYPQTKVTDTTLITALNAQTLQADNTVTYNGSKYKRVYFTTLTNECQADNGYYKNTVYWFKFEPIQWRVLSNTNDEFLVMAVKILETRQNTAPWSFSILRTWLNNDFYNTAFNTAERTQIKTSTVINDPIFGDDNTSDKLFLLSYGEVTYPAYGFNSDTARMARGTDFSKSSGLYVSSGYSYWWLRTLGYYQNDARYISSFGTVSSLISSVDYSRVGVRPAFRFNLPTDIFTSKAGSTCVIDYVDSFIYGIAPGSNSLADYVNVVPGYEISYVPTTNGFGTGTTVNVTIVGLTIGSFKIVLYGDVNGDGSTDSMDAGVMVDNENYLVSWDPPADAEYIKAGDLNGDGSIDSIDAGIVVDSENYMSFINQSTGIGVQIEAIAGTVLISGLPKFGSVLTADTTNITPAGATLTYLWKRGGVEVGIDKTYTVTAADIGKSITVTVTGVGAYTGGIRSQAVTPTKLDTATPAAPTLTSKTPNKVTLKAIAGREYKIEGGEWQSNVFTGLNSNTAYNFYTRVAETATHYASASSTAFSVTTYEKDLSGTVMITGTAQCGATLTANITNVRPTTATLSYQWKRGDEAVSNNNNYKISVDDIGQPISVTVTGKGDYFGSLTSTAIYPTTTAIGGTVTITGTAVYGETLTGKISSVTPSGAALDYQWKRGETVIGNNLTYAVSVDDIGQSLTFTVNGTDGYTGSITSAAVIPVKADVAIPAAPTLQSVTSSTVTLNAVVGQEYKVDSGEWQESPVFTGLNKNTSYSFYTRVAETATHNESAVSIALSLITPKVLITGTVLITGNLSVGQTLTADISGIVPNDATLSYIWKAGNIQISTENTYTVLDADIGELITVTVTGTGDYTGSIKSAAKVITS